MEMNDAALDAVCSVAQTLVRMTSDEPTIRDITDAVVKATCLLHYAGNFEPAVVELKRRFNNPII